MKPPQIITLAILASISSTTRTLATPCNLVINGEFESPTVSSFAIISQGIDGWSSTLQRFEIWEAGFLSSPMLGSDGLGTGQHLEMDVDSNPTFSQEIIIPAGASPQAEFSFDAWLRSSGTSSYSVSGTLSGTLVDISPINMSGSTWTRNAHSLTIIPGETVTLSFVQGSNTGGSGAHIDQVALVVDVSSAQPLDLNIEKTEEGIRLDWFGTCGYAYQVARNDGLTGAWEPDSNILEGEGARLSTTIEPLPGDRRFFRIRYWPTDG